MSRDQARLLVLMHFRALEMAVFTGEQAVGKRATPDLIVMDRDTGATTRVRVMVGKRPRKTSGLYYAKDRVGLHADVVALVDRDTREVSFRPPDARNAQSDKEVAAAMGLAPCAA